MTRNYKQEKLKEMGIDNPIEFVRYMMLEDKHSHRQSNILFDFLVAVIFVSIGISIGVLVSLFVL